MQKIYLKKKNLAAFHRKMTLIRLNFYFQGTI